MWTNLAAMFKSTWRWERIHLRRKLKSYRLDLFLENWKSFIGGAWQSFVKRKEIFKQNWSSKNNQWSHSIIRWLIHHFKWFHLKINHYNHLPNNQNDPCMSFKEANDLWYVPLWNHKASWMISSGRNYCSKTFRMAFNKSHWSLWYSWSIGTIKSVYESSFRTTIEMKRNLTCSECNLGFIQSCWITNSWNIKHERKSNRECIMKVHWWCWRRYYFNSLDCTFMNFRS